MDTKNLDTVAVLNGNARTSESDRKLNDSEHHEWDTPPIPMTFRTALFKHGEQRAVDSMALKSNEDDIRALEEHADAMAEEAARNVFDAENNLADKLHAEEFARNLDRRDDLRQKSSEASRQLHGKHQELAALGSLDGEPHAVSMITKILLGLLVGATIVLTLHDFVFDFDDEILNWLVSGTFAFLLGLAVVWIETQNTD
jgi:hypothetical protein